MILLVLEGFWKNLQIDNKREAGVLLEGNFLLYITKKVIPKNLGRKRCVWNFVLYITKNAVTKTLGYSYFSYITVYRKL